MFKRFQLDLGYGHLRTVMAGRVDQEFNEMSKDCEDPASERPDRMCAAVRCGDICPRD